MLVLVDNRAAQSNIKRGRSQHPGASVLASYMTECCGNIDPAKKHCDRLIRFGHALGTIKSFLRMGDIFSTTPGRKTWSYNDMWLARRC